MKPLPPADAVWPRNRWVAVVALLLAVQAAVVWQLAAPLPELKTAGSNAPVFRLVLGARDNQRLLDSLAAGDPAMFARVSASGFSGAAWLKPPRQEYRLQDWSEPDRFMDRSTSHVGGAFRDFLLTSRTPPVAVADKQPVAPLADTTPSQPAVRESSWRVDGPLRGRPVVQPVQPRSFTHTDLLADTAVQVLVKADGLVYSPRLVSEATQRDPVQRAADQHALDLTRLMRFQPQPKSAPAGELTPGTLTFRWHVVPPATNAPAPNP